MGRLCPVCHKGPFRQKALKEHIKINHPSYYALWIQNGPRVGSVEIRKRKKQQRKQKQQKK